MKLEVKKILENLAKYGESTAPIDNIVTAMNQTRGMVLNRIFNSETGTKDVSGAGLGGYSNTYAEFRRSVNRQTKVVDLELTGSLRRDIKVVTVDNKISLAVVSNTERQKVADIEKRYKKNIFDVSEAESDEFYNTLNELFRQDINKILTGEY